MAVILAPNHKSLNQNTTRNGDTKKVRLMTDTILSFLLSSTTLFSYIITTASLCDPFNFRLQRPRLVVKEEEEEEGKVERQELHWEVRGRSSLLIQFPGTLFSLELALQKTSPVLLIYNSFELISTPNKLFSLRVEDVKVEW